MKSTKLHTGESDSLRNTCNSPTSTSNPNGLATLATQPLQSSTNSCTRLELRLAPSGSPTYTPPGSPHTPPYTPYDSVFLRHPFKRTAPSSTTTTTTTTTTSYRNFIHKLPHTSFHAHHHRNNPCIACSVTPAEFTCNRCALELCRDCKEQIGSRMVRGDLKALVSIVARWKFGFSREFLQRERREEEERPVVIGGRYFAIDEVGEGEVEVGDVRIEMGWDDGWEEELRERVAKLGEGGELDDGEASDRAEVGSGDEEWEEEMMVFISPEPEF